VITSEGWKSDSKGWTDTLHFARHVCAPSLVLVTLKFCYRLHSHTNAEEKLRRLVPEFKH
jgi:hypothetical protein